MGWFESQIEERRAADQKLLEESFVKVAGVVLGERGAERIHDDWIITKGAIDEILKYYHLKPIDVPENVDKWDDKLDYCLRPYGIMRRDIILSDGWYKDAFGPILAFTKDDDLPVALIPGKFRGYGFTDPKTGQHRKVNAESITLLHEEAICFYYPLPQKRLKITDLLLYMKRCINLSDIAVVVFATFAATIVGLAMPRIVQALTGPILLSGKKSALIGVALTIIGITISTQLLNNVIALLRGRINTKVSLGVQSSMMMRLLSLPASFFRSYSPGELRSRSQSVEELSSYLMELVMTTGLTSLSSLLYVTQIFRFAPALVIPAIIIVLITVGFSAISTLIRVRIERQRRIVSAKESGMSYGLITGVQKIKLSGSEKRAFAKWLNIYSEGAELTYNPPLFIKVNGVISTGITLISNIVLYYLAIKSGLDQSNYYAFTTAYGMLMGAFMSVSGITLTAAQIRPILEMAEPFLKEVPETAKEKEIVTEISGRVELDNVSFRYDESSPYVVKDLSLKIHAGEYVAIVGKTGCGKSTLVRLLLGFEIPEKGAIYYDGKDIGSLDLPSLRKRIGTVTQDAGLFQGDIYSNIVITAPELSLEDAWEAAEKAGIADDIRQMPMGMHTVVSEGQGGISGGQRQRLMIARAICPKPNLLIFDEATSALDNKTQRQVSESLDSMGCTRIIIAHRLSTIRHADRIVVLDGGRIIEDGTYDELLEKKGFFAELVERQRLES